MLSTNQVAKQLGLTTATLSRYISSGKIPAPKMVKSGGMTIHLWTEKDINRVKKILPKIANGRKTRYEKQRKTQTKRRPKP
jgi:excisionase family DNA binding protein